ncbi:hypothetical protein AeRB84_017203 [Aphanomyces euteiches]|nr:hypothetical protein AeRB84_017203 [Aphanomyces euteiches]
MANIYWKEKTIWIPDVYPSFQKRAAVRAGLLLVDCVINGWWYPFQWAVNQSSVRNHWGGTLDYNEISLDDGIVVILAIAYIVASIVCVRVQLVVVVIIYMSCDYMRQELNGALGIFADMAPDIKQNYFNNIVSSHMEAMDLWTYYENFETNFWLIANERTYLIVAMGISIFFVLLTKLATWKPERSLLSYIHFGFKEHVRPIASIQVGACGHKLWTLRSTLYHDIDEKDVENTKIERCAGTILQETYGFVAMTVDYEKDHGRVYVTPQGLWLLEFVIVNDQYVVEINDYIYVVINSLSGRNFFSVIHY